VLLLGSSLFAPTYAADVARDIREGRQDETVDFGGYLEIGLHGTAGSMPVVGAKDVDGLFSLGGHFRFKRFFIDALSESNERLQAGYNLYSGPTWSMDVIASLGADGVDTSLADELATLRNRNSGVDAGLRVTGFSGPFIVEFEALIDATDNHDGSLLTGSIARQYLVRNWNLHWLVGARYQSAETTNFLFGVSAEEAEAGVFQEYEAGAGVTYVTEFGATLPLTKYFVFRGSARYWSLPDSIVNSPFIENQAYSEVTASIVFVY